MKRAFIIIAILFSSLSSQWLELIMYLPHPTCYFGFNPRYNKIYVGPPITVINSENDSILKTIYLDYSFGYPTPLFWTSKFNKLYVPHREARIFVLDAERDTIIDTIFLTYRWGNCFTYNAKAGKIYVDHDIPAPAVVSIICEERDSLIRVMVDSGRVPFWNRCNNRMYWKNMRGRDGYVDVRTSERDSLLKSIPSPISSPSTWVSFGVAEMDTLRNLMFGISCSLVWGGHGAVGYLVLIDGERDTVLKWYPRMISSPGPIIWNSRHNKIYLISKGNDYIIAFDYINEIFTDIPIPGGNILGLFYNWLSDKLYLYDDGTANDELVILRGDNDSIIRRLRPPFGIEGIGWNWIENKIYVGGRSGDRGVLQIYRDSILSIEERQISQRELPLLKIYPNPARSYLAIRLGQTACRELKIYDVSGKLIKEITPKQEEKAIRVSLREMKPGVYILEQGKKKEKFVITK